MIKTDICIIGAGPGGAAAALKLSYLGQECTIIDKATFPRDKTCGDAISGKVLTLMKRMDPEFLKDFTSKAFHEDSWGIRFVTPNKKKLDIPFKPSYERDPENAPGYICKRIDFDNYLIEKIKTRNNIQLLEGVKSNAYTPTKNGWEVNIDHSEEKIECKLLLIANGAQSNFTRKVAGLEIADHHKAAAVRAYYKGIKGIVRDNFIELHFLKELTPGYFWIFPLPNGESNVGLGMRSDFISKKRVNLKKEFTKIIENHPEFKERFENAEAISPLLGYSLPLGSQKRKISGQGYMLIGDAGYLIDPLTGEGIGHAFYSGIIAAEQAIECLKVNDFSAQILKDYDARVWRVLGTEMKLSYQLQRLMKYPWLVNAVATILVSNKNFILLLSKMYADFELRKQLVKPFFWFKMLFSKK